MLTLFLAGCCETQQAEDNKSKTGACVHPNGSCDIMSDLDQPQRCESLGGIWKGAGSNCQGYEHGHSWNN